MRAIITLLNDGTVHDVTPAGAALTCELISTGVFKVMGSQGLVPFPPHGVGWGYSLSQMDAKADVEVTFDHASGELHVNLTKDGQPYQMISTLMLHVMAPDLPELPVPPALAD
ncbi:hypothetical protein [Pseudomonas sp. R32]|uniref:hypothetical protein n=1 Tax=Pseudomonas sp. R32 TaxID=1573704 RepID=UPI00132E8D1E|nr:hypothetical protein [Pseudomonas sp. R32]QHF27380.1 hypothetical protein PspR32_06025 [Pseudomonas sp. R32]